MRKWKRDYLSPQKLKSKNSWKSEEGMTLVELLASITILLVVILLVGSVHIFGQRQFINQTESASQANDLSYSLSVMSRDLRRVEYSLVEAEQNLITVENGPTYRVTNSHLTKNSEILSERVQTLNAVINEEDKSITITLISTGNQQNQSKNYETTIYFRR